MHKKMSRILSLVAIVFAGLLPTAAKAVSTYTVTMPRYYKDEAVTWQTPTFVQGGSGSYVEGTVATCACTEAIPAGYYASGWSLEKAAGYGGGTMQTWGAQNSISITYQSGWASKYGTALELIVKIDQKKYSVTYNANNGSWTGGEPTGPQDVKYWVAGQSAAGSGVAAREGYAFAGWNTASNGSGTFIAAGATLNGSVLGVKNNGDTVTLYAQWTPNQYPLTLVKGTGIDTVYYKVNGASGWTVTQASETEVSVNFGTTWSVYAKAATGYTYTETSVSKPKSGKMGTDGAAFECAGTPNKITVSYKGNGSTSGSTSSSSFNYNETQGLRKNGFVRSYRVSYYANGGSVSPSSVDAAYAFTGWNNQADGSGDFSYSDEEDVTNPCDATGGSVALYAQWNPSAVSLLQPTRDGYDFLGWYTAQVGGLRVGGAGEDYTPTNSVALYAQWTDTVCTVTFDARGGTCAEMTREIKWGDKLGTLPEATKDPYAFEGWYDSPTPTYGDAPYTQLSVIKTSLTLYAKWSDEPVGYTITTRALPTQGGTVSGGGTYSKGSTVMLTATPATGYAFVQWSDGDTSPSRQFAATASATYEAQFAPGTYTLYLDPQEGSLPAAQQTKTVTYDAAYGTLPEPTPASDERVFQGWFTAASGGTPVEATTIVKSTANPQYLYAQWGDKDMCALVYAPGAYGWGEICSNRYERGTHVTVTNALYAREGYVQWAWSRDPSGASKSATFGNDLTLSKNETFYPCWSNNAYTIAFDGNGGTGDMAPQTARYDEPVVLSANRYGRDNDTFLGWSTRPDGPAVFADSETVSNLTAVAGGTNTLYAVWQKPEDPLQWHYTIHFSPNADVVNPKAMTNLTVLSGIPVTLPDCLYTNLASSGWAGWIWNGVTNKTIVLDRAAAYDGEVIVVSAAWDPLSAASSWVGLRNANLVITNGTTKGKWAYSDTDYRTEPSCASFDTTAELSGRVAMLQTTVCGPGTMTYWVKSDTTTKSRMSVVCGIVTNSVKATGEYCSHDITVPAGLQTVSWNVEIVTKVDNRGPCYYLDDVTWTPSYTNRYALATSAAPAAGGTTTGDGTYDVGTTATLTAAAHAGYTFVQWNDGATNLQHAVTVWGDITDYVAEFQPLPNTYYVVFDGNGATDPLAMPVQTNACGVATALAANRFVRTGYAFDGWRDTRTGVAYADGAWVTDLATTNATALLRAVWVPSATPVPTPEDRRDIADVALVDGRLQLAIADADARFAYQLRGTNDLVAPKPWPVHWTTNGTGVIVIEPPKTEDPQMFYYLQVIQKP